MPTERIPVRESAIRRINSGSRDLAKLDGRRVGGKELAAVTQAQAQLAMAAAIVYLGDAIREIRSHQEP